MTDRVSTRRQVIGSRVIDVQLIPFMRSRKVFFRARGMRPRTRYFPYFGDKAIDDFARNETTFQRFATRTDDNSKNPLPVITANGLTFSVSVARD